MVKDRSERNDIPFDGYVPDFLIIEETTERHAFCVVSFPGEYEEEWETMTADLSAFSEGRRGWGLPRLVSSCVFLPAGHEHAGKHVRNTVDDTDECYCHVLYGEKKPWGCYWFGGESMWKDLADKAVQLGYRPMVAYKMLSEEFQQELDQYIDCEEFE